MAGEEPEFRTLSDPRTLRAVTHPVRIALIEALALEGPLTATAASELIGESATTCSFHFRQLAKYGFVEEAGGGPGRTRPWRLSSTGMHFSDVTDDPEVAVAARALQRLLHERYFQRLQTYLEARATFSRDWQEATGSSEYLLHLTAAELRELGEQIRELFLRYLDRFADPSKRPPDALPVEILLFAYPVRPERRSEP